MLTILGLGSCNMYFSPVFGLGMQYFLVIKISEECLFDGTAGIQLPL